MFQKHAIPRDTVICKRNASSSRPRRNASLSFRRLAWICLSPLAFLDCLAICSVVLCLFGVAFSCSPH